MSRATLCRDCAAGSVYFHLLRPASLHFTLISVRLNCAEPLLGTFIQIFIKVFNASISLSFTVIAASLSPSLTLYFSPSLSIYMTHIPAPTLPKDLLKSSCFVVCSIYIFCKSQKRICYSSSIVYMNALDMIFIKSFFNIQHFDSKDVSCFLVLHLINMLY